MSRKGIFAHLNEGDPNGVPRTIKPLAKPKAMAAVTKSLGDLSSRSQRADELEKQLAQGQAVVDIEPSLIDGSFVNDRMDGDIDGLRDSISEQGQQVPILVRPHPSDEGRYQVAYGHRRLRAVAELGRQVKAVVRELSDEQLVIAQGQENNERRDLSYIERARFAERLQNRDFSREVITASMSILKSELSTMLSVVSSVPTNLIDAIGPAPGIGRPSWQKLAEFCKEASSVDSLVEHALSREVQANPSADRFKLILAMTSKVQSVASPKASASVLSTPAGTRFAEVSESKSAFEIKIDKRAAPDFGAYLQRRLPALFAEHEDEMKLKNGE